jgi:hypothetical protein
LSAAAIFNAAYRPARRGRKVAYLTVVSFVFLVVALSVFFLVSTQHGGQNRRPQVPSAMQVTIGWHWHLANGTKLLLTQKSPLWLKVVFAQQLSQEDSEDVHG